MITFVEFAKAFHFFGLILFFLCFSLWIREEFVTIFNRKKLTSFNLVKVLVFRLFGEQSGFTLKREFPYGLNVLFYLLVIILGISPLFFVQLTDRFDFRGMEVYLGLVETNHSWIYFISMLAVAEFFRSFYTNTSTGIFMKIPLLCGLLLSFAVYSPTFSIEQMVQFQKSFSDLGLRNYFLLKNPVGLFLILSLLYYEMKNPQEKITLIDHVFINTYVIMFIFGFLGGYGLPSILEKQNISPGLTTLVLQNISLIAKFIFTVIILWVGRYSLIRPKESIGAHG